MSNKHQKMPALMPGDTFEEWRDRFIEFASTPRTPKCNQLVAFRTMRCANPNIHAHESCPFAHSEEEVRSVESNTPCFMKLVFHSCKQCNRHHSEGYFRKFTKANNMSHDTIRSYYSKVLEIRLKRLELSLQRVTIERDLALIPYVEKENQSSKRSRV